MRIAQNGFSNRETLYDILTTEFITLRRNYNIGTIKPNFEAWYELVEEFSSRNLTVDTDILPAIAGAAFRFRALFSEGQHSPGKAATYVAGLWQEDLRHGLFWGARTKMMHNTRVGNSYYFYRLSRPTGQSQTRFPSWSWASARGPVQFPSKPYHQDSERWRDFEIVAIEVGCGHDDLMAKEVQGEIRIRAPLVQLWYDSSKHDHSGSLKFERDDDDLLPFSNIFVDIAAVMDSDQSQSRECWLLVTTGPPHVPFIILLDKVGDSKFRRIGYALTNGWLQDEHFARFDMTEFTLV